MKIDQKLFMNSFKISETVTSYVFETQYKKTIIVLISKILKR